MRGRKEAAWRRFNKFHRGRRFIFGGYWSARSRESIAATNTRGGDSKARYRIISDTGGPEVRCGPKGKEGARPILWGTRAGVPARSASIMPRGAYRPVYLRAPLCTDGADNIDVAIIL